ncbi:MAG: hypothetical protein LKF71_04370 [Oscillospiraceae bacterium]|jgi:hypothetical protein|nr:hypothetical protein [Oscillospiraceae bacterium]
MKGTLKLKNGILIDGKTVTSVTYDTEKITAAQFAQADARKQTASHSTNGNLAGAFELDYGLHLYLGFEAIMAENPQYAIEDLERITGHDLVEVMSIGRNFIIASPESAADSTQSSSAESSEITPEPTAAALQNSSENG